MEAEDKIITYNKDAPITVFLPEQLQCGATMTLCFSLHTHCPNDMMIRLQEEDHRNIMLQVKYLFNSNEWSFNCMEDDTWDGEEMVVLLNLESKLLLRPEEIHTLAIVIYNDMYRIYLDDKSLMNFRHRLDFARTTKVLIDGPIAVKTFATGKVMKKQTMTVGVAGMKAGGEKSAPGLAIPGGVQDLGLELAGGVKDLDEEAKKEDGVPGMADMAEMDIKAAVEVGKDSNVLLCMQDTAKSKAQGAEETTIDQGIKDVQEKLKKIDEPEAQEKAGEQITESQNEVNQVQIAQPPEISLETDLSTIHEETRVTIENKPPKSLCLAKPDISTPNIDEPKELKLFVPCQPDLLANVSPEPPSRWALVEEAVVFVRERFNDLKDWINSICFRGRA